VFGAQMHKPWSAGGISDVITKKTNIHTPLEARVY
jgi:hypothetical protein